MKIAWLQVLRMSIKLKTRQINVLKSLLDTVYRNF